MTRAEARRRRKTELESQPGDGGTGRKEGPPVGRKKLSARDLAQGLHNKAAPGKPGAAFKVMATPRGFEPLLPG